jgi:hypothetical protein
MNEKNLMTYMFTNIAETKITVTRIHFQDRKTISSEKIKKKSIIIAFFNSN